MSWRWSYWWRCYQLQRQDMVFDLEKTQIQPSFLGFWASLDDPLYPDGCKCMDCVPTSKLMDCTRDFCFAACTESFVVLCIFQVQESSNGVGESGTLRPYFNSLHGLFVAA